MNQNFWNWGEFEEKRNFFGSGTVRLFDGHRFAFVPTLGIISWPTFSSPVGDAVTGTSLDDIDLRVGQILSQRSFSRSRFWRNLV